MRSMTAAAIVFMFAVSPVAVAQQEERVWTADQQAVIDALSRGPVGIGQNDERFEDWKSGYHPDWTYWRLGSSETRPRDEHMSLVREYVGAGNRVVGFELDPVDVIVRGDTALVRLNATETIEQADGATRIARYSSAAMLVRERGRWWLLATSILHLPDGE